MAEVNSRNFEVTISSEGVAGPAGPVGPIGPQGVKGDKGDAGGLVVSSQILGDLNNALTPGMYMVPWSQANAGTNNTPSTSEGHLEVIKYGTAMILQRYTVALPQKMETFQRLSNDVGATWTDWNTHVTKHEAASNPHAQYALKNDVYRTGTGSPEGVVAAPVGSRYIDTNATNGAVEWIKAAGTGNTGWKVVYGDTGWRDVAAELPNLDKYSATYPPVVFLRRMGNNVSIRGKVTVIEGTPHTFYVAPVGFRGFPGFLEVLGLGGAISEPADDGVMYWYGPVVNGNWQWIRLDWMTNNTWPTTLPGTAA